MRPAPPSLSDGDNPPDEHNGNSNGNVGHSNTNPPAVIASTEHSAGNNDNDTINASSSSRPSSNRNPNLRFTTPANLDDIGKRSTPGTSATQRRERVRRSSSPAPSSALLNSQSSQGEEGAGGEEEEEGNGGEAEYDSEDDAPFSDDDTYDPVPFGQANTSLENRLRYCNAQNNPLPSSAPPDSKSSQGKGQAEEEAGVEQEEEGGEDEAKQEPEEDAELLGSSYRGPGETPSSSAESYGPAQLYNQGYRLRHDSTAAQHVLGEPLDPNGSSQREVGDEVDENPDVEGIEHDYGDTPPTTQQSRGSDD